MLKCLNLGCGDRFHVDWTNVDLFSSGPMVQQHNLRLGFPFPDGTFDVVYHSHILEHFRKDEASFFMRECYRVLKSGGIVRVVVPDLERIATLYLTALRNSVAGDETWQHRYDWIVIEMYDQVVREEHGGAMFEYLKQKPVPCEDFVYERLGTVGHQMIDYLQSWTPTPAMMQGNILSKKSQLKAIFRDTLTRISRKLHPSGEDLLNDQDREALRIGRFRMSGETHHWMYDRYSLAQLLLGTGFVDPIELGSSESLVLNWTRFGLDTEPNGVVYKPDSLYMEAVKPAVQ